MFCPIDRSVNLAINMISCRFKSIVDKADVDDDDFSCLIATLTFLLLVIMARAFLWARVMSWIFF